MCQSAMLSWSPVLWEHIHICWLHMWSVSSWAQRQWTNMLVKNRKQSVASLYTNTIIMSNILTEQPPYIVFRLDLLTLQCLAGQIPLREGDKLSDVTSSLATASSTRKSAERPPPKNKWTSSIDRKTTTHTLDQINTNAKASSSREQRIEEELNPKHAEENRTCADSPCFSGVPCEAASSGSFRCGNCPHGYKGNGITCKRELSYDA